MTNSKEKGFIHPRYHGKLERGRIILKKGGIYINREDGEQYELIEYLDEDAQVMIRNLHTRQSKIASIHQLENFKINEREDLSIDLSAISSDYWEEALEKYEMIKPLLDYEQHSPTSVRKRAKEVGVSERSLYRWIQAYNSINSISALVNRKRGWIDGNSRLSKEQDELVASIINEFYLHKQRPSIEQTIREVQRVASQKGIDSPSRRTIRQRILRISEEEKLRKRGQREKAKNKFTPKPNSFPNTANKRLSQNYRIKSGVIRTPIHSNESISSWLIRAALDCGTEPLTFTGFYWDKLRLWTYDLDRGFEFIQPQIYSDIRTLSLGGKVSLDTHSLYFELKRINGEKTLMKGQAKWVIPRSSRNRSHRIGQPYCPCCLDEIPY